MPDPIRFPPPVHLAPFGSDHGAASAAGSSGSIVKEQKYIVAPLVGAWIETPGQRRVVRGALDFLLGKNYLLVKRENYAYKKGVIFAMVREKGEFRMLNEIGMAAFEESVRMQVEEERSSRGMTESSLGKLAFPHVADARRKVQSIRKGQGAGENRKPQQLRGTDILNLCEAVGLSWKKVFSQAIQYAEKVQEDARLASIK